MHAAAQADWLSFFHWRGAGATPVLGVDLATTAVHVVELQATTRGPRISHHAHAPLQPSDWRRAAEGDAGGLVEALRRAVKASGSRLKSVALALPASAVITRTLSLPQPAHDEALEMLVEADAAQSLPFPRDEISLDFASLGPSAAAEGMIDVLLVAARSERIAQRVAWAEEAGLKAAVIGVESHAVVNAVHQLCGDDRYAESLLHFSGDGAHCLFVRGERLLFERELGQPLPFSDRMSEGPWLAPPSDWLDAACREWQRHSQLFAAAAGDVGIDRLHLVGAGAYGQALAAGMRERLGIDVGVPDPFAYWASASDRADGDRDAACLLACGLALSGLPA